jgi:hypothetical protein
VLDLVPCFTPVHIAELICGSIPSQKWRRIRPRVNFEPPPTELVSLQSAG